MVAVTIEPSWNEVLKEEFNEAYFVRLTDFVRSAYKTTTVFPPPSLIFNAFNVCPFNKVQVVILGQDPYHDHKQAHGLCFSVNDGVAIPPSLQNIFKEIERDLGVKQPSNGNLTRWATQGVLLLNAVLTVQAHTAASHQGIGWETFTDAVISKLSVNKEHLVFMLWGKYAQKKISLIDTTRHLVLQSVHPSPLSAYLGFIGNGHFSKANNYLQQHGKSTICW